ncbi:hypothetical protein EON76_00870 [bacterium]|nr:MAG: hypothetical protein EON76_00870 [bacterium]
MYDEAKYILQIKCHSLELQLEKFEQQRSELALHFATLLCDELASRLKGFDADGVSDWFETKPQRMSELLGTWFDIKRAKELYYNSTRCFSYDVEQILNKKLETTHPIIVTRKGGLETLRSYDLVLGGRVR